MTPGTTLQRLLRRIDRDEIGCLLWPGRHNALLTQQRARLIISRVRLVALLFGVLTPLWILIDLLFFPWPVWGELAAARLLTSAAFLGMALYYRPSDSILDAWFALALLFAIPTLFFIYSHPMLALRDMGGMEAAIAAGYAFLPFVMIAGLSIFPLSALEAAVYAVPVLGGQAVAALMQLEGVAWTTHIGAFWLLLLIASVAALASMSQLQFMTALVRESSRDPLTQTYNRLSGERILEQEMARARRQDQPLAVAFVDLDRFKELNDVHGHEAGDRALTTTGEALRHNLRVIDSVIRWGGEEFLLVLPGSDRSGAAEAIRRIAEPQLCPRPDGPPLTASVGIAAWPEDGRNVDWRELVQTADRRMYLAKGKGGACIMTEDSLLKPPRAKRRSRDAGARRTPEAISGD